MTSKEILKRIREQQFKKSHEELMDDFINRVEGHLSKVMSKKEIDQLSVLEVFSILLDMYEAQELQLKSRLN